MSAAALKEALRSLGREARKVKARDELPEGRKPSPELLKMFGIVEEADEEEPAAEE